MFPVGDSFPEMVHVPFIGQRSCSFMAHNIFKAQSIPYMNFQFPETSFGGLFSLSSMVLIQVKLADHCSISF